MLLRHVLIFTLVVCCVSADPPCSFAVMEADYDLCSLKKSAPDLSQYPTATVGPATYYMNPMGELPSAAPALAACQSSNQLAGSAMVQIMNDASKACWSLGKLSMQVVEPLDPTAPRHPGVLLTYLGGTSDHTVSIAYTCSSVPGFTVEHIEGQNTFSATVASPLACGGSWSTGSQFLLILFLVFFGYFGIGYTLNVVVFRREGIERIPNIAFWQELPLLVKDGIVFSMDAAKDMVLRVRGGNSRGADYTEVG
eukprot:gnl/Spiro4/23089_TR11418_c0_g1_i1.p1 gnl/Spiro4/23089_TR11418_c0_g1~~gnl/Spiro4/23089_TR11418_c0_g1_i1.p1  ORF type:complete len:253 (+),score=44.41 gnl/Spiro4/23089_TR11418_c0_g1_i1:94-852(+)